MLLSTLVYVLGYFQRKHCESLVKRCFWKSQTTTMIITIIITIIIIIIIVIITIMIIIIIIIIIIIVTIIKICFLHPFLQ